MTFELTSSGHPFLAYRPDSSFYLTVPDALSLPRTKPPLNGFLVVKNVFSLDTIQLLRDSYFSLFSGKYTRSNGDWIQSQACSSPHGVGAHPARAFVRSKPFLSFINNHQLFKLASSILSSSNAYLCPRAIVRSFSLFSPRCTYAHRDCDYFHTSDTSQCLTAWIPVGPADISHGQLVYLSDSAHRRSLLDHFVRHDLTIGTNLGEVADITQSRWIIPDLSPGDVVFHCLNNVHASFDTSNTVPRLSIDLRFTSDLHFQDSRWINHWSGDDGL